MFSDLARRGLTHPNAVGFVKRNMAITTSSPEDSDNINVAWGAILLYVSFFVAAVFVTMVSISPGLQPRRRKSGDSTDMSANGVH
jgi:hypothetical protein